MIITASKLIVWGPANWFAGIAFKYRAQTLRQQYALRVPAVTKIAAFPGDCTVLAGGYEVRAL
jgi:hypothetical protein